MSKTQRRKDYASLARISNPPPKKIHAAITIIGMIIKNQTQPAMRQLAAEPKAEP